MVKVLFVFFPTKKACHDFNMEMLNSLTFKIHELVCTDEVDETISIRKWNKKASEQLDKLNSDCNKAFIGCWCTSHVVPQFRYKIMIS